MMSKLSAALLVLVLLPAGLSAQQLVRRTLTPNNRVFDMARKGDTLYFGGSLTQVGFETGGAGFFYGDTPYPDDTLPLPPRIDGIVQAMVPDGAGGWYLGGSITQVGTTPVGNLVHILPNRQLDNTFLPQVDGIVNTIALSDDTMFFGGTFLQVDGQSRHRIAALSVPAAQLTPFNPGANNTVKSMAVVGGDLYIGGNFTMVGDVSQPGLARLHRGTGQLRPGIGPVTSGVNVVQAVGDKVYVGGSFLGSVGQYAGKLARFDGASERPRLEFPRFNGNVRAILSDGSGGWYVGGEFTQVDGLPQARLAHILSNGTIDPAFAPAPNNAVYALAIAGGTLYAGGAFTNIGGQARNHLAALSLTTGGALPFDPDMNNRVNALAVHGNMLVAAGLFTRIGGRQQARLAVIDLATGIPSYTPGPVSGEVRSIAWADDRLLAGGTFNGETGYAAAGLAWLSTASSKSDPRLPAFNGAIHATIPDGNGGWYVGGTFSLVNGQTQQRLAHVLPDSTLDPTFNFPLNNAVYALARQGSILYIGGVFTQIDGNTRNRLAAIDLTTQTVTPWNPDVNNRVSALFADGAQLYIGGQFTQINGQTRNRLASFDLGSGALTTWAPDVNNTVNQVIVADTVLWLMGSFTAVNGQTRNRIARVGKISGGLHSWSPNLNNEVKSGFLRDSLLWVVGTFTQVNGQTRTRLAGIHAHTGVLHSWNPGANTTVETITGNGSRLWVGGSFTQIAGQPVKRLAGFDLATGDLLPWQPDPSNTVYALAEANGQLLAGGIFEALHSQSRSRLLALSDNNFDLLPWNPIPNGSVHAIWAEGADVWLGGAFTQVGGQPRSRLARVDTAGVLAAFDPGADGAIEVMLKYNDTLLVGGTFAVLGGQPQVRLGKLVLSTGVPLPWHPQPDNTVLAAARAGTSLLVGGSFDGYRSRNRNRMFCIDTAGDSLTGWNPDLPGIIAAPRIQTLAVRGDTVWVGGRFSTIGGVSRANLACTDALTGAILAPEANTDGEVFALRWSDDTMFVGGNFLNIGGQARRRAALLNAYDGQLRSFEPSTDGRTYVIGVSGSTFALGGDFSMVLTQDRQGGYAIDTRTGKLLPWNPGLGPNSFVNALAIDARQGHVYLGGSFSSIGGQPRQRLARVDAVNGLADTWQADANQLVNDLLWDSKRNAVYVAGNFTSLGGQPRSYLGRVGGATGQIEAFDPAPDGPVSEMVRWSDDTMFVRGMFGTIGGAPRHRIAALRSDGQATGWNPVFATGGGTPSIFAIAAGGDRLYVGGFFSQVDGQTRHRLAAFDIRTGRLLPWQAPVNPLQGINGAAINNLATIGDHLFVLGTFTEINGTTVNNIAWIDGKSGLVKGLRAMQGSFVLGAEVFDSLLYVCGDFALIDDAYHYNVASYRFDRSLGRRQASLFPRLGGNTGDVTLRIQGMLFEGGTRVILRRTGLPDIAAFDSLTHLLHRDQLHAVLDLRNQLPGMRDVLLVTGGDTTVLTDAFEVVPGDKPEVWAYVVAPPAIRRNPNSPGHPVFIHYGNNGHTDAEGVPIWLAISPDLHITKFDFEILPTDSTIGNPGEIVELFVDVDTIEYRGRRTRVYVFVLPRVPAQFHGTLGIRIRPDTVGRFFIDAWATQPLYGSPLKYAIGACADALIGKLAGFLPAGDCIYNTLDALLLPMFDAAANDPAFGSAPYAASWTITLAKAVVSCGVASTGSGLVLDIMSDILRVEGLYEDIENTIRCLEEMEPESSGGADIDIRESCDPNQKGGPGGVGDLQWFNPATPLGYLVEFENLATASAPAQQVIVLDTLDMAVFDLATLELRSFSIADSLYEIPQGRQFWDHMVDLRPRIDAFVRVTASLDTTTGVLRWVFDGLQPSTLAPLDGGFLPPNVGDPEGRGSVSYQVRLRPGLPTWTPVANRAAIYFDFNAPIITNTWHNTLDRDAPASAVYPLDSTQAEPVFDLRWTGHDTGSGIRKYDLYAAADGGAFVRIAPSLRDTTFRFTGERGTAYAFYTIAKDSVGNVEQAPAVPDATTRVLGSQSVGTLSGGSLRVYPNPSTGAFTLELDHAHPQTAHVVVFDALGRQVLSRSIDHQPGTQQYPLTLDGGSGVYILTLRTEAGLWHRRIVVE